MKKNGFTLIEILVVIVLAAAISVTIGVSMQGMQERQTKKEIKEYKETLEKAACVYVEINNITSYTEVTVDTLIKTGLIKKNLKNPETNKTAEDESSKSIIISWTNGEKTCKVNE